MLLDWIGVTTMTVAVDGGISHIFPLVKFKKSLGFSGIDGVVTGQKALAGNTQRGGGECPRGRLNK